VHGTGHGANVPAGQCGGTTRLSPRGIISGTLARFGRLDVLVNNAVSEEPYDKTLAVNLKGPFRAPPHPESGRSGDTCTVSAPRRRAARSCCGTV
jgi:NAD(P)-dependent dehydrogenase (short-subunit alcohol dehydrogenase family)